MEENEAQLQLKKRARRRLVGAVFFASVVAVVLPMVMDQEPRQTVQDVEIRIPGQDEKSFAPKFAAAPVERPVEKQPEVSPPKPVPTPVETVAAPKPASVAEAAAHPADTLAKPTARVLEVVKDGKTIEKSERPPEKSAEKPVVKTPEKPADKQEKMPSKAVEKPADKKPAEDKSKTDEAKRAAALLSGGAEAKPAGKGGEFLILIGAFANEANVKNIKEKLGEQGIRTFAEPLETPQGKKTRVRAGPFPNRDAADKALAKMQRIGVSGVVAAKP